MNKLIKKLRKAFATLCVMGSAKPKPKTLEERIEILENLCDMYYSELYTYHTNDICVKGKRISKIDRLENIANNELLYSFKK